MPGRLLVVEQQPDAPPGLLGEWAAERGIAMDVVRPAAGEALPPAADLEAVAVLGADASVHAGDEAWIGEEVAWLRDVVAARVPVLGLCFGAQALAAAMGATVARLARPEIGWVTVEDVDPLDGLDVAGTWFAWHEDGFAVPAGAQHAGRSAAGAQAFVAGPHLGLQFHPEVTPAIDDGWLESGGRQLAEEALDPDLLRAQTARRAPEARAAALRLFDAWTVIGKAGEVSGG